MFSGLDTALILAYLLGWLGAGWFVLEFLRKIDMSAFGGPSAGW